MGSIPSASSVNGVALIVPQAASVQPATPGTKGCGAADKDATGPGR